MRMLLSAVWLASSLAWADDPVLTLDAALATADLPHPSVQAAQADLDLAVADQSVANSADDATLSFEGVLRRGQQNAPGVNGWADDDSSRLVLRKNLFDFGRSQASEDAARLEVEARRLDLMSALDRHRIDIMSRYFDVLLADAQYGADNELTAVYFVRFDNAKKRFELGDMSPSELAQIEAQYQDQRQKRGLSQGQQRITRQKLADAMNQPGHLPSVLEMPKLPQIDRDVPEYDALLPLAMAHNRKLQALESELKAVDARVAAVRSSRSPTVDAELVASDYSRQTSTRDRYSGGLVLNWPLYQGERVDARVAREVANRTRLEAQVEQLKRDLAETLLETRLDLNWLKTAAMQAARVQANYRDQALERARAEYEMELKTTLGTAMADTQLASLRLQQTRFRIALDMARLNAMLGRPIDATLTLADTALANTEKK